MFCGILFLYSIIAVQLFYWYLRSACVCVVNKRKALATFKLFITYSNLISFQRYLLYFSVDTTVPQKLTYCLCEFRWKAEKNTTRNFVNCIRTTKLLSFKNSVHNRNKYARICPLSIMSLHLKSPLSQKNTRMHYMQAAVMKLKKLVNLEFVDNELWWCCWVTFNAGASCCGLENSMERASYACSRYGRVLLGYFFSRLSLPLSGRRQDID